MGCCGDEEEDNLLHQPLISSPSPENLETTAKTTVESTISLMNSHFSALICRDILRIIFQKLPIADIARAACVCRTWSSVASDRDIQTASFKALWKLKEIVGDPISGSFWRDNSLSKFAITHRIRSGDSVASLAVKYSVQVMDIKRLNNMMSDHGIHSRERLLIPLSNPDILINRICYIELDVYANREAAVLYLEGGPPENKFSCSTSRATSELAKKRVIESVRRSLLVDDEIARYYLSITDGDPRSALSEFSEDLSWERQTGLAWRTFKQKASHC